MSEITLYAKDRKLATSSGTILKPDLRPTVQWREQVTFTVRLASGTFPAGSYHYAFDVDRDFLNTAPCNTGECTLEDSALHFTVVFDSISQARATNGRKFPLPFYIQVTRQATDESGHSFADYILDDAIWVDGCVWDGNLPASEPISNYYTKEEIDALLEELTPGGGGKQVQADWKQNNNKEVDYIKNKPTIPSESDYIPQTQKGAANGVPTLNSSAKIPDSQLPDGKPITTISASDSTYTLADGCFEHTPLEAPTYTLPAVTDATRTHWIVLTVNFSNTQSIAFEDSQGTIIVPLDTLTIAANDVVEYLCQFDPIQSKWVIACGKLN